MKYSNHLFIILAMVPTYIMSMHYNESESEIMHKQITPPIPIQQLIDIVFDDVNKLNAHVNKTVEDAQKLKEHSDKVDRAVSTIKHEVDTVDHTANVIEKHALQADQKLAEAESTIDSIQEPASSLIDLLITENSLLDALSSKLDTVPEVQVSIIDKLCNALSIAEIIDSRLEVIQSTAESIIEITETTIEVIGELDSKEDIILSKVCDIVIDLESSVSLVDNMSIILSIIDELESTVDNGLQPTAESILDKACTVLTLVDQIDSDVETLQSTLDSTFDKTCMILSIVDDVDSKADDLLSHFDIIESKVCRIQACDNPITQADVGIGGIYTISLPGVYCLIENVTFTTGSAITVNNTSDVYIQMGGHTIDGGNNPGTIGVLVNSSPNVKIDYGFITGTSAGIRVQDTLGQTIFNDLKITNGNLVDPMNDTPGFVGGIIADNSASMIVTNCYCSNVSPVAFHARNGSRLCTFRNCTASSVSNAAFVADNTSSGCVFDSCSALANTDAPVPEAFLNDFGLIPPFTTHNVNGGPAFGVYGSNCKVINCQATRFFFSDTINGVTQFGRGGAFDIYGNNHIITRCLSTNNDTFGFHANNEGHIIEYCVANSNPDVENGFFFGTPPIFAPGASLAEIPLEASRITECVASNNFRGFELASQAIVGAVRTVELDKNVALGNLNDGFHTQAQTQNNQYTSNTAVGNGNTGFLNNVFMSNNRYHNNSSCFNSAAFDYIIFIFSIAPFIQGASDLTSYWMNVDCRNTKLGRLESAIIEIEATLNDFVAGP